MANSVPMQAAVDGDTISEDALSHAVNFCNEQADGLRREQEAAIEAGAPAADVNPIRDLRNQYRAMALDLTGKRIRLLAGEARISADHIASAVAAAQRTIDSIQRFKDRLKRLGAVLDFFATLLTGNGKEILAGAKTLKEELEA